MSAHAWCWEVTCKEEGKKKNKVLSRHCSVCVCVCVCVCALQQCSNIQVVGVTVVIVCVYLSVPALAVTCHVYKYQMRCCRAPYGITNVCIVWISQKNALFKRYGVICLPRGPSTLSADRRLTNGSGQD